MLLLVPELLNPNSAGGTCAVRVLVPPQTLRRLSGDSALLMAPGL